MSLWESTLEFLCTIAKLDIFSNTLQIYLFIYEIKYSIRYLDLANSELFDQDLQLVENAVMSPRTRIRNYFA